MSATFWIDGARKVLKALLNVEKGRFEVETLPVLITTYAVCSVAYYVGNAPLVSDKGFDALCDYLFDHHKKAISAGGHPHVLIKEALEGYSGRHMADRDKLSVSAATAYPIYDAVRLLPHSVHLSKAKAAGSGAVQVRLRARAHVPDPPPLERVQRSLQPVARDRERPAPIRHRERPKCSEK